MTSWREEKEGSVETGMGSPKRTLEALKRGCFAFTSLWSLPQDAGKAWHAVPRMTSAQTLRQHQAHCLHLYTTVRCKSMCSDEGSASDMDNGRETEAQLSSWYHLYLQVSQRIISLLKQNLQAPNTKNQSSVLTRDREQTAQLSCTYLLHKWGKILSYQWVKETLIQLVKRPISFGTPPLNLAMKIQVVIAMTDFMVCIKTKGLLHCFQSFKMRHLFKEKFI